jgi:hypothetical protein
MVLFNKKEDLFIIVTHGSEDGMLQNPFGQMVPEDTFHEKVKSGYKRKFKKDLHDEQYIVLACHEDKRKKKYLHSVGDIKAKERQQFLSDNYDLVVVYNY